MCADLVGTLASHAWSDDINAKMLYDAVFAIGKDFNAKRVSADAAVGSLPIARAIPECPCELPSE
eukprot:7430275-Pyramimonas_sp.AAC.1